MLLWSQLLNKQIYDDLFLEFGRSLKPDLIIAQWAHLGDFQQLNFDEPGQPPPASWQGRTQTLASFIPPTPCHAPPHHFRSCPWRRHCLPTEFEHVPPRRP